jgi:glycosyltransferase involved in cell wall biosynthesis
MNERIAVFVPTLEGGGAERVMLALANFFGRSGWTVDLVLQRSSGPYMKEVAEGVRVVDLKANRLRSSLRPLIRYLRSTRPNALLSTPSDANIVAVAASVIARVPVRVVVREAITASVDDATYRGPRARMMRMMRRWAYQHASHIVAPSAGVADDLVKNSGIARSRVSVIANALDTDRIESLALTPDNQVALPRDARVILGVGRLSAQKDFATLIRAFARISASNTTVLLLGEGDQRQALMQLASELGVRDKVVMPGFVENPFAYMKRAAVFVLSSRYEGLPNAMLQALLIGTPVVATDCASGPREILEGGRWGRLVPVGDVDAMAAAIREGLDGTLATPPASLVRERYGVEGIAKQYLEVLFPRIDSQPTTTVVDRHAIGNRVI